MSCRLGVSALPLDSASPTAASLHAKRHAYYYYYHYRLLKGRLDGSRLAVHIVENHLDLIGAGIVSLRFTDNDPLLNINVALHVAAGFGVVGEADGCEVQLKPAALPLLGQAAATIFQQLRCVHLRWHSS